MDFNILVRRIENTSTERERIISFLLKVDEVFYSPLSQTVNIKSYAEKTLNHGIVIIAEIDGNIIGAILGYANDSKNMNAYISSFAVLHEYRSIGIGGRLINTMKKICLDNGMRKICLYTHKTNLSAIRFYKKNNFNLSDDPVNRKDEIYLVCDLVTNNINEKKNILVTAIGSFSADVVIKTLKENGHYVVGCDIYPKEWIVDAINVDNFYQAPYVKDEEIYINFIEEICSRHKIEFIFPLTDPEVELLSSHKNELKEKGIHVCVSEVQTIKLCRDKYKSSEFLLQEGIKNVIYTRFLSDAENVELPVFIKPINGRSSEGCRAVYNIKDYENLRDSLEGKNYIIQPFIEGNIITVDVVRDPMKNDVVCIARRELLRNKSGAGTTVEIFHNAELEEICVLIAQKLSIIGAVNFEFIEAKNGELFFLEINPRFSGGVEFSQMAGYNVVANHFKCFRNIPIEKKQSIKKMIIARKYEEYVTKIIND